MRILLLLVFALAVQEGNPDPVPEHVVKEDVPPVSHQEASLMQDEPAEESPLKEETGAAEEPNEVVLEPEETKQKTETDETSVMVEEPALTGDYLIGETPEEELEEEPKHALEKPDSKLEEKEKQEVEKPETELEAEHVTELESKEEEGLVEEPTLEAEYLTAEEPEMKPVISRSQRGADQPEEQKTGRQTCGGVVLQGKCYRFFRGPKKAPDAEFYCQGLCVNGHLASVTSSYIHGIMMRLMDQNGGRTRTWIGGLRYLDTGRFIWLDGAQWSYADWLSGEPNNTAGVENCVEILSDGKFNDMPCWDLRAFICSCPV